MDNKGCCGTKDTGCSTTGKDEGKKGCCWMTLLKGTLLAGIVLFAVCALSCKLIPVHNAVTVTYTVASETPPEAPSVSKAVKNFGKELKSAMSSETPAAPEEKPMGKPLAETLLLSLFGGLLLTKLQKKSCGCPVRFGLKVGLLVGSFSALPALIWYGAPVNFVVVGLLTHVVAFTVAALALSKLVLKCDDAKASCH